MKVLYIMRHGKSDWSEPDLADYDRPLKKRGRKAAEMIAEWLLQSENVPEHIWTSGALRAADTADLLIKHLGEVSISRDQWLYSAAAKEILTRLSEEEDAYSRIMIIGHNPVLEELIGLLVSACGCNVQLKTAAIVKVEFDAHSWQEIKAGGGKLAFALHPALLTDNR